jgi:glutamate racemase
MKANKNSSIGIFDSGVGGTSIWKEITALLPNEHTIYLADSKNAPYGEKSKDEIIALSVKNTELLLNRNCKIIVVACNTATTNAIQFLRDKYKVPFIGIEPAIKSASLSTKNNTIGILATQGTLNSRLFETTSRQISKEIKVIEQIGEGLVTLIENGKLRSKEMTALLESYIDSMLKKNIDCLVLGCTHYPYLIPQIQKITGSKIQIIDSGEAVAKQTKSILEKNNLLKSEKRGGKKNQFYSNKNKNILASLLLEYKESSIITELDF